MVKTVVSLFMKINIHVQFGTSWKLVLLCGIFFSVNSLKRLSPVGASCFKYIHIPLLWSFFVLENALLQTCRPDGTDDRPLRKEEQAAGGMFRFQGHTTVMVTVSVYVPAGFPLIMAFPHTKKFWELPVPLLFCAGAGWVSA